MSHPAKLQDIPTRAESDARQTVHSLDHNRLTLQLDHIEILEEAREGGTGVVHKGYDKNLQKEVAIKVLRGLTLSGETEKNRFKNEALAMRSVTHTGIVQVIDSGEHQGVPYLIMEWVGGGTLAERLKNGVRLPVKEAVRLIADLTEAIAEVHRLGWVHRDIKPANLLLDPKTGKYKLTDFGIAKCHELSTQYTKTGTVLGTPGYMAPEQYYAWSYVGPQADIYAIGVILHQLLSGKEPIESLTNQFSATSVRPGSAPFVLPNTIASDLRTICMRCLEQDPPDRYGNANELLIDLRCYLNGKPIQPRNVTLTRMAVRWAKKHPLKTTITICLLAAMLVSLPVITWLYLDMRQTKERLEIEYQKSVEVLAMLFKLSHEENPSPEMRPFRQRLQLLTVTHMQRYIREHTTGRDSLDFPLAIELGDIGMYFWREGQIDISRECFVKEAEIWSGIPKEKREAIWERLRSDLHMICVSEPGQFNEKLEQLEKKYISMGLGIIANEKFSRDFSFALMIAGDHLAATSQGDLAKSKWNNALFLKEHWMKTGREMDHYDYIQAANHVHQEIRRLGGEPPIFMTTSLLSHARRWLDVHLDDVEIQEIYLKILINSIQTCMRKLDLKKAQDLINDSRELQSRLRSNMHDRLWAMMHQVNGDFFAHHSETPCVAYREFEHAEARFRKSSSNGPDSLEAWEWYACRMSQASYLLQMALPRYAAKILELPPRFNEWQKWNWYLLAARCNRDWPKDELSFPSDISDALSQFRSEVSQHGLRLSMYDKVEAGVILAIAWIHRKDFGSTLIHDAAETYLSKCNDEGIRKAWNKLLDSEISSIASNNSLIEWIERIDAPGYGAGRGGARFVPGSKTMYLWRQVR